LLFLVLDCFHSCKERSEVPVVILREEFERANEMVEMIELIGWQLVLKIKAEKAVLKTDS